MESKDEKKNVIFIPDQKLIEAAAAGKKSKKPTRKLIFLSGFKNTGKNAFADILKKVSIEPVVQVAFADALKKELYPTLGQEYESHETESREWKDAHRAEIIAYGESQKQAHGMYHWVSSALDSILTKEYDKPSEIPHIVVTDCRRVEEMMWFKHFKLGHFIELAKARDIYEPIMYVIHRENANIDDTDYLTHISLEYAAETRMFDKMIRNYGSKTDLENTVKDLYAIKIR